MRIFTQKGWLDSLDVTHADELFQVIHASRSHLYPWLPWLKRIHSPQDTAAFILKLMAERGPQFVVVVDEQICGGVGFYHLDQAERKATVGYWLGAEYTGHGIMVDAVRHLCQHGFQNLLLEKVEIRCAAENLASRKVPERLGFYYEGVLPKAEWLSDRYVDHAIYSILKEEFTVAFIDDLPHYQPLEERVAQPLREDQSLA